MMKEKVSSKFREMFGPDAILFASPGRINLIGEHTDYNGGFVFPGAVDKGIVAAIRLNGTDKVRAYALDLGESSEFGLREEDKPAESWACYIFGVCREIQKRGGVIGGFDTVFAGDVPLGAGMSSSAALESTYAFALNDLYHCGIDKFELAKIGQSTEHNYCGVNCGIMDQFASVFGKKGCLMRLDCRSLEYAYFPFDPKLLNWSQEPTWKTEKGVYNPCTTQFNYEHIFSCSIYDNMLGTCIASGRTRDFKTSEFTSVSSEINNRNIALFPEKIDGLFCHQDHPRQRRTPPDNMRMSFSPELINRGEGHAVMTTCLGHGD